MDIGYVIFGIIGAVVGYLALRYRWQARYWMRLAEKYDREADTWYNDWLETRLDERS
jgi:hypothetical protein